MLFPNGDSIEPLDSVNWGSRGCFPVSPRRNGNWASTSLLILGPFFTALQNSRSIAGCSRFFTLSQRLQSEQGPLLPRWVQEETSAIRQFVAREGSGGFAAVARPLAAFRRTGRVDIPHRRGLRWR